MKTEFNMDMIKFLSSLITKLASGEVYAEEYSVNTERNASIVSYSPLGEDVTHRLKRDSQLDTTISLRIIKPGKR